MEAPLIQGFILQPRIFYLIDLIQQAIYSPAFVELIIRTVGEPLRARLPPNQIYRFYMRGSSAAILQLSNEYHVPIPFTSDIDMMLIVDPDLPAAAFTAIRGLLFQRVIDTILAFSEDPVGKNFGLPLDLPNKIRHYDRDETGYEPDGTPSKRIVVIDKTLAAGKEPLQDTLFDSKSPDLMVGKNSAFTLTIRDDIVIEGASLGLGLIEIIPRTGIRPQSLLDISFPKINFLQFGAYKDISRIHYEWKESENNIIIPINVPKISRQYSAFRMNPGQAQVSKITVGEGFVPEFTLQVPIVNRAYAEIDQQAAIATTKNPEKQAKRTELAAKLRNKISRTFLKMQ